MNRKTDAQDERPSWVIDPVVQGWKSARFVEAYFHHSELQRQWAWEALGLVGLRPDQRILDFGCGDGKVTACLSRLVGEGGVVGHDASPTMIEFCRTKFPAAHYPRLEYVSEDLETFARGRRETFDLVTSFCVFHIVPEPRAVLEHLHAVLRRGGTLLLVIPVGDDNPDLFETAEACFESFGLPCPWERGNLFTSRSSMVSVDGCGSILEEVGFRVDHIARDTHPTVFLDERELVNWMVGTLSANWHVSFETAQEFFAELVRGMVARDPAMKSANGTLSFRHSRLNVVAGA
ncbi:MAG: class I SAM-dependent methyltransferase [Planctomycetota bacterium]|jgi:trans-aconitate methyltransferase